MVPAYSRTKDGITFLHPDNNSLISVEPCAVLFSSKSRRKEAAILKEERERKWGSRKGFWYRAMHWMEQPTTETAEDRAVVLCQIKDDRIYNISIFNIIIMYT